MEKEKAKVSATDFSEYYHNKIALCLETIYNLQYEIRQYPILIYDINIELHQIFKMIHGKLGSPEKTKQKDFHSQINKLKPIIQEKKEPRNQGQTIIVSKKSEYFNTYKELCELREFHIWECLEKLRLTTKSKDDSKIVG